MDLLKETLETLRILARLETATTEERLNAAITYKQLCVAFDVGNSVSHRTTSDSMTELSNLTGISRQNLYNWFESGMAKLKSGAKRMTAEPVQLPVTVPVVQEAPAPEPVQQPIEGINEVQIRYGLSEQEFRQFVRDLGIVLVRQRYEKFILEVDIPRLVQHALLVFQGRHDAYDPTTHAGVGARTKMARRIQHLKDMQEQF